MCSTAENSIDPPSGTSARLEFKSQINLYQVWNLCNRFDQGCLHFALDCVGRCRYFYTSTGRGDIRVLKATHQCNIFKHGQVLRVKTCQFFRGFAKRRRLKKMSHVLLDRPEFPAPCPNQSSSTAPRLLWPSISSGPIVLHILFYSLLL